jgi:PEGA domain
MGALKFPEADGHGKFSIKVVPGSYGLAVTSPGFRRWTKRIRVQGGESQRVDVLLEADDKAPSD